MNEYIIIGILLAIVALSVGWMFITSRVHYSLRMLMASFVVGVAIYTWTLFNSILGFPVNELPPDKSVILAGIGLKSKKQTFLWIRDEKAPKAYAIPYSDEFMRQLQAAQQKAQKNGGYVQYRRPKKDKNGKDGAGSAGAGGEGEGGGNGGQAREGKAGRGKPGTGGRDFTDFTDESEGGTVEAISPLPQKD